MRCVTRGCQKPREDAVNGIGVKTLMCLEHMKLWDRWRRESEVDMMNRRPKKAVLW